MTLKDLRERRPLRYSPIAQKKSIKSVEKISQEELVELNERIVSKIQRNELQRYGSRVVAQDYIVK